MNNLPKVATQWNSGETRESNPGPRVRIPGALTTTPLSRTLCTTLFRGTAASDGHRSLVESCRQSSRCVRPSSGLRRSLAAVEKVRSSDEDVTGASKSPSLR